MTGAAIDPVEVTLRYVASVNDSGEDVAAVCTSPLLNRGISECLRDCRVVWRKSPKQAGWFITSAGRAWLASRCLTPLALDHAR